MSCMQISLRALAGVREFLEASELWSVIDKEHPGIGFIIERMNPKHFVQSAYIFNRIELSEGKEARENQEPESWRAEIALAQKAVPERLKVIQVFKTVQMIDYNTESAGWLTQTEYENWNRKAEYEQFKKYIRNLKIYLAEHIIDHFIPEYEQAEWDLQ